MIVLSRDNIKVRQYTYLWKHLFCDECNGEIKVGETYHLLKVKYEDYGEGIAEIKNHCCSTCIEKAEAKARQNYKAKPNFKLFTMERKRYKDTCTYVYDFQLEELEKGGYMFGENEKIKLEQKGETDNEN
jgi:hypothetical protein